jgi:hypothetical protein
MTSNGRSKSKNKEILIQVSMKIELIINQETNSLEIFYVMCKFYFMLISTKVCDSCESKQHIQQHQLSCSLKD